MRENTVLKKLDTGAVSCGMGLTLGSPMIAEILADMGCDWLMLDAQHGNWSNAALVHAIQVISATPTVPIVRVPGNDFATIGRMLDTGAMGILVPLVNSADDAQRAADATYYPPFGSRSLGSVRLRGLERYRNFEEESNAEILLAVQIESAAALAHVEEIAAVDGVDCVFIGPYDLALSMGCPRGSDEHEEAIQHVLGVGKEQGVAVGYFTGEPAEATARVAQGFQFLWYGIDAALLSGAVSQHIAGFPK